MMELSEALAVAAAPARHEMPTLWAALRVLAPIAERVARFADQMDEDAIGIDGTESKYLSPAAAELRRILREGGAV